MSKKVRKYTFCSVLSNLFFGSHLLLKVFLKGEVPLPPPATTVGLGDDIFRISSIDKEAKFY